MSIFEKNLILKIIKRFLIRTIYKPDSIARILKGPLKGYKYKVNVSSGWSPIYGNWEPVNQKIFEKIITKGMVVYDIGANTGVHTLLFSKAAGDKGKVYAFEPLNENCRILKENLEINGVINVAIIKKAVSDFSGKARFSLAEHNKQGSLEEINKVGNNSIDVEVISLDDFISEGYEPPDFIKIDIEGAEGSALEGFAKSLVKSFPAFIVELHSAEQNLRVCKFFNDNNYKIYKVNDNITSIKKGDKILFDIVDSEHSRSQEGLWGTVIAIYPGTDKGNKLITQVDRLKINWGKNR